MKFAFYKMDGAGNDFVVIDHRRPFLGGDRAALVARICDRRRGVGADGVLLLERDEALDFAMVYYNADGGEADFCGNGARCLASLALDLGLGRGGEVGFRAGCGPMAARRVAQGVRVDIGLVGAPAGEESLEVAGLRFAGRLVVPGVPHFVCWVDRVEDVALVEWGGALRRHPRFAPRGANVDFAARLGPGRCAMRTYERGVEGETLACGSGAVACALAAAAGGEESPARVRTAGGDELVVDWRREADNYRVGLAGPARVSFTGEWQEGA